MVDRLEELLALLEAEDEEERESGLEIQWAGAPARPAPAPETEERPAEPGEDRRTAWTDSEAGEALELPGGVQAGGAERRTAQELDGALRTAAEAAARLEAAGRDVQNADASAARRQEAGRGLEELYRRTAQAAGPAALAVPVEQAGRIWPGEEPGRSAALAVDELDRAVRRDSRRYDGGMSIF